MNQSINPRRIIIALILILLVSSVVLFWLRDVVREVVVLPLSYLFFVAGILIDSTPQLFFWLAVLLIAFWIAYRSISSKRRAVPPLGMPIKNDLDRLGQFSGRVSFWTTKVAQMRRYNSSYYQSTFHQSLSRLVTDLMAHRYRLSQFQVEERLRSGLLEVPPDVRDYILASMGRFEPDTRSFLARLLQQVTDRIKNWFYERFGQALFKKDDALESQTEAQIERVIQYMEEELELSHDYSSQ